VTGTVTPPRPRANEAVGRVGAAGPGRRPGPSSRPPVRWRDDRTFPATLAVTALTLSVAVGFGRLFSDGAFLAPVVLATVTAHAVAWWCRRNELPTGVSAAATLGAVGLIGSWLLLGHTTAYGVPLPLTLRTGLELLGTARDQFATVKAPAAALPGFVLACVLALGISAFMADWAAFRLQATFEALIPSFTLFLFTSALGTPRHRTWAVAAFVAAVLVFLVVHGLARSYRAGAWFGGRPAGGPGNLVRTAAALGAVGLVAGLAIGPRLPGPDGPVVKYKNRVPSGPSNRSTISPLVDIRGRIVDQRNTEMFTVKADAPTYWRLTSLDTFDGTIWSSNSTYRDVRGTIRSGEILQPSLDTVEVNQQFSIEDLASIWLPAAFRPSRVTGLDVSYATDTGSLITPEDTTDGTEYTVVSKVPRLTPALLNQSPPQAPQEVATSYLALPPTISRRVDTEARRITARATTPYERALALQNHFKTNYRYDINAGAGHDEATLETFLFQSKTGYCEQFAGVYAVLARINRLPARVAVGFTPGVYDEADGLYHVKGGHAHAWAEVYLHNYGWVPFDPTPGRGDPQASSWTGQPPAQDDIPEAAPASPETSVAPGDENPETPTTDPSFDEEGQSPTTPDAAESKRPAILTILYVVLALEFLWSLVVAGLHLLRRLGRWQPLLAESRPPDGPSDGAGDSAAKSRPARARGLDWSELVLALRGLSAPPSTRRRSAHVLAAWADLEETFDRAGSRRHADETMFEFSRRVGPSAGLQPEANTALRQVAQRAATAAYGNVALAPEEVSQAVTDARTVRTAVLGQLTWWDRLRWWVDPRPLLNRPRST
jgi:transglutaminase-like putative cysteine protease